MSSGRKENKPYQKNPRTGPFVARILGSLLLILLTTTAILGCFAAIYIKNCIKPNVSLNLNDFFK
ncbi:MAG: hypothetical protein PHT34_04640, partial [Oscillospiraceae bacterium]|nr:hypothetical protein [Oscillospiraceae bacterium]